MSKYITTNGFPEYIYLLTNITESMSALTTGKESTITSINFNYWQTPRKRSKWRRI